MQLIRAIRATIRELDTAIAEALTTHPWAELITGPPRIGTINLGQIIGEIGPVLERAGSCAQLAAETGAAPVTKESGQRRSVNFRHAVNHRARQALTIWADNSRRDNDWAATIYNQARARGETPSPRSAHSRAGMAADYLGLLAHQNLLRPRASPSCQAQHTEGVDLGNSQDRLAIVADENARPAAPNSVGFHHAAFEVGSLKELTDHYRELGVSRRSGRRFASRSSRHLTFSLR
ncbi:MAG TPA: transposase [Pseudonocardiaceae bacterium]